MGVSHDMRTPLACIQMATSLLLEDDEATGQQAAARDEREAQGQERPEGAPALLRLDQAARDAIREISARCKLLLGARCTRAATDGARSTLPLLRPALPPSSGGAELARFDPDPLRRASRRRLRVFTQRGRR